MPSKLKYNFKNYVPEKLEFVSVHIHKLLTKKNLLNQTRFKLTRPFIITTVNYIVTCFNADPTMRLGACKKESSR